jgi:hypothetical protein
VSRYTISEVVFFSSAVHVLLVFACIEERGGMVLAERVVRVHEALRISLLRSLNIPESVVWYSIKNLLRGRLF